MSFLQLKAQNYTFTYSTDGRRVCLVDATVNLSTPSVTVNFLDYASNSTKTTDVYRRLLNGTTWTLVADNLAAGTQNWTDTDVILGNVYEYKTIREDTWTWTYDNSVWDAVGYTCGSLKADNTGYQGQMILLVDSNIVTNLATKLTRLKRELTADGWYVNQIAVDHASSWSPTIKVVTIRNQIITVYNNAPANDKPKVIFILGHVPMPRSGTDGYPPDGHDWHMGARGFDGYYADIDGVYTDTATFTQDGLLNTLQVNMPGDYKWDQNFYPSDLEMAFGRVDFADLIRLPLSETQLMERYLDRLSNYKNVATGFDMGKKTGFYKGDYPNAYDGSYRCMPSLSRSANVYQNTIENPHPQWVLNNGPFKMYMQNETVPDTTEWNDYGMNATVYSSMQSSFGYNDLPQEAGYVMSTIRALLAFDTKCLVTLWGTMGLNLFHTAGTGMPLGLSMQKVFNSDTTNDEYYRPMQNFDHYGVWYRTHFGYNGDPTIRLYQVLPPNTPAIVDSVFTWHHSNASPLAGYNIYESTSEFGIYNKINTSLITDTMTTIEADSGNWYMVKAVMQDTSGTGVFLTPSLGVSVMATSTSGGGGEPEPEPEEDDVTGKLFKSNGKILKINGKIPSFHLN